MIKGETIELTIKTASGTDGFGQTTYTESTVEIDNVIVGSPSFEAAVQELNLTGKRLAFILGIPKDCDYTADDFKDTTVYIRGDKYRTYGYPLVQTDENVPGRWNMQVKVEAYE